MYPFYKDLTSGAGRSFGGGGAGKFKATQIAATDELKYNKCRYFCKTATLTWVCELKGLKTGIVLKDICFVRIKFMDANIANRPDNSPSGNRFSPFLRKLVLLLALGSAATESGCQGVGGPNYQARDTIEVKLPDRPAPVYEQPDRLNTDSKNRKRNIFLGVVMLASIGAFFFGRTNKESE